MLLSLWQLNLQASGGGGGGTGGPIPATKNPAPQRATKQYVHGRGFFTPELSTVGTAPLLGQSGKVPLHPYIFSVDFDEFEVVQIEAGAADTTQTITEVLSFPDIDSLKLDPTDAASLKVIPRVWLRQAINGLIITSVEWDPQALQSETNEWVSAVTLNPGFTYTAWRVLYTIQVRSADATPATTLNLGGSAEVIVFSI